MVEANQIRNHILQLHVPAPGTPLTAEELDQVSYLAQTIRARVLSLPAPVRPGVFKRFFGAVWRAYSDRRASARTIAEQAQRIGLLEETLEDAGIDLPGNDQAGKRRMAKLIEASVSRFGGTRA